MRKTYIFFILFLVSIVAVIGFSNNKDSNKEYINGMVVFKSQSCGCCDLWSSYIKREGFDVSVKNTENMDSIKTSKGIPSKLQSCHTAEIGNYFIEGHIPKEAINKLLSEKPNILGIAMPGMPSGSPGMPGRKTQDFVIYAVNKDGSYDEFMRL